MPNCVLLKPETTDACGPRRILPHRFYSSSYFGNRNDFSLHVFAPAARTTRSLDSVRAVAPVASQSGAENENGAPRAQSLTESGDAVVLNLVLRQALCVRSRRIAVDPMAGFNAKAMPIMLPTPLQPDGAGLRAQTRPFAPGPLRDAFRGNPAQRWCDAALRPCQKRAHASRGLLPAMRQALAELYPAKPPGTRGQRVPGVLIAPARHLVQSPGLVLA